MGSVRTCHHNINRNFLLAVGLWPYQVGIIKYTLLSISLFCMISQSCLQIAGMFAAWEDKDVFMESIPPVLVDFICGCKVVNSIGNSEKMKELLTSLEVDWAKFKGRREIEIMDKYAIVGRRLTLSYAGFLYGSMMPFMIIPAVPIFINIFGSTNVTQVKELMFRVDFFLDAEKYYWPLLIHSYICTMAFITVVVAIDTMFMTHVQHACGCFAVLGYQLENIVDKADDDIDVYPRKTDDRSYHLMAECVAQHNHSLVYSSIIESTYNISYFFQLGINMVCMSFTGFQTVMHFDRPEISARYAAFTLTQLLLLFLQSYPAQSLYDHSTLVADYVNNCRWYYTSIRTRKLIGLMTLRSRIPSALTAGKFYVLNLANFGVVFLVVLTSWHHAYVTHSPGGTISYLCLVLNVTLSADNLMLTTCDRRKLRVVRTSVSYMTVLTSMK